MSSSNPKDWTETYAPQTEFQNEAGVGALARTSKGYGLDPAAQAFANKMNAMRNGPASPFFTLEEAKYISPLCEKLEAENQDLLVKINALNKQRVLTVARIENQKLNLKAVREAVGENNERGNKLAAALLESMQRDIEILETELRTFA